MAKEERREPRRQKIEQQEKSGQSVRAFCSEQGLGENSFYWCRQRFRRDGRPVRFALLETKPADDVVDPQPIEWILASGDHLRIPAHAATLRLVLSVLRAR